MNARGVLHVSLNREENIGLVLILSGTGWGPVHFKQSVHDAKMLLKSSSESIGLAVIDYDSYGKEGLVLAGYLQSQYPYIELALVTEDVASVQDKLAYFPRCRLIQGPILDRQKVLGKLASVA
jgi:hypothetical protein